jgi:hypothetical protein
MEHALRVEHALHRLARSAKLLVLVLARPRRRSAFKLVTIITVDKASLGSSPT